MLDYALIIHLKDRSANFRNIDEQFWKLSSENFDAAEVLISAVFIIIVINVHTQTGLTVSECTCSLI